MKQETIPTATFRPGRHLEVLDEVAHDPYQEIGKISEPAVCSNCGAVYREGRWQWVTSPMDAYLTRCPAQQAHPSENACRLCDDPGRICT